MVWKVLIPFLRPLVPVAVDYARARMQTVQRQPSGPETEDQSLESLESLEMRLLEAEARVDTLTGICNDLGNEIARFTADVNARMKSARTWSFGLLAWNLLLTVLLLVLWLR